MTERRPGVLLHPNNGRDGRKQKGAEQCVKARAPELTPEARDEREHHHDRDELERVRVFAEKPKPDEQPRERPMPGKFRIAFQREPESVKRRDPKENRKRIDRHDEGADVKDGCDVEREHDPESSGGVEEPAREVVEEQTRPRSQDWTPKAHAKIRRTEKGRARPDGERHPGALAEVSGRETLRPHPVMRFVERKIGRADQRQPNARKHEEKQPDCARRAHVPPIKRECRANNSGHQRFPARRQVHSNSAAMSRATPTARKAVVITSLGQCAPR